MQALFLFAFLCYISPMKCQDCGSEAKYYDTVNRRLLFENRRAVYISIERYKCTNCKRLHRDLNDQLKFKQYSKAFIFDCLNGKVDLDSYEFPASITVYRWSQKIQLL